MQKLNTVKSDKKKIVKTIGELDNYKNEALLKTWRKVDKYFRVFFIFI